MPPFDRAAKWWEYFRELTSLTLRSLQNPHPFSEIYGAAAEVGVETGEAKEMLVDGQERITTLFQYFTASPDLKLRKTLKPYAELTTEEKERFLQYEVVVRDLGKVGIEQIREVFRRINATRYALNAMEIHNARYEGELKACVEELAQRPFLRYTAFSVGRRCSETTTQKNETTTQERDVESDRYYKGVANYDKSALQATNDRGSRIARGEVIREVLNAVSQPSLDI